MSLPPLGEASPGPGGAGGGRRCKPVLRCPPPLLSKNKRGGGGNCLRLTGASADFCGAVPGVTSGFRGDCLP